MINIKMGTVTGYETGTFLNIENVQILQVVIENQLDAQPALLINPAMDESAPKIDDRVLIIKIGNFALAIGGIDGIEPVTAQGEKRLYSRDSAGAVAAFITLLTSGVMELNGNNDNAVRFSALESGFNTLRDNLNSAVFAVTVDPGTHVGATTGIVTP
ncbi:hypothetical protein KA005_32570, partial [bacterium]|nr:hypothetical protein [bacterium]